MNNIPDSEISRRLALAIGWPRHGVQTFNPPHDMRVVVWTDRNFRLFDYRDPAVIWPIAERFDCFPSKVTCGDTSGWLVLPGTVFDIQDTAAKAVALAVIKAKEQT